MVYTMLYWPDWLAAMWYILVALFPNFCFVCPTMNNPGSFTDVTDLCQSDPGLISAVSPVIVVRNSIQPTLLKRN